MREWNRVLITGGAGSAHCGRLPAEGAQALSVDDIGNPEELPVLADSPIEHVDIASDDPQRRCPDIGGAHDRLGGQPAVPYSAGQPPTVVHLAVQSAAL